MQVNMLTHKGADVMNNWRSPSDAAQRGSLRRGQYGQSSLLSLMFSK